MDFNLQCKVQCKFKPDMKCTQYVPVLIASSKDIVEALEKTKLRNDKHDVESYTRRMQLVMWPARFFEHHPFINKDWGYEVPPHIRPAVESTVDISIRMNFIAMLLLHATDEIIDLAGAGLSSTLATHLVENFLGTIGGCFFCWG